MLNLTYGERNRECEALQSLISNERNERNMVCGERYMLFPRSERRWEEGGKRVRVYVRGREKREGPLV